MRRRAHTKFWWGEVKEKCPLKDVGVSGRVVLKWMMAERGLESAGLGEGQLAGCCEYGNELLGFIMWGIL